MTIKYLFPGMLDTPVIFEPTLFKRDSYISDMMSGLLNISGRLSIWCGCPPSYARTQSAGTGILGYIIGKSSIVMLLFSR